jgi:hypothetical protein
LAHFPQSKSTSVVVLQNEPSFLHVCLQRSQKQQIRLAGTTAEENFSLQRLQ